MASKAPAKKPTAKPAKKPILHFWGVRGSIPTPGTSTRKFGGNTACVELRAGDQRLIFDAGTGLRTLGQTIVAQPNVRATILLSHYHWDHLLGLPFFGPIFKPDTELEIYGEHKQGGGPKEALQRQFAGPSFPVEFSTLASKLNFHTCEPGATFSVGPIEVQVGRLNHPNAAICYRATVDGKSVVYASDHEHDGKGDAELIEFTRGANVLIYDSMYADESYGPKRGWGHSTWQEALRVAKAAKVKRLFLYHHDPVNDDAAMTKIERAAQKIFPRAEVAREGLEITL
jgi:phosphoribosyl 1,2-cyclic phosphodiesterase